MKINSDISSKKIPKTKKAKKKKNLIKIFSSDLFESILTFGILAGLQLGRIVVGNNGELRRALLQTNLPRGWLLSAAGQQHFGRHLSILVAEFMELKQKSKHFIFIIL